MLTYLSTPVRAVLLAAILALTAQTADARGSGAEQPQTTATTRASARTKADTDITASDRDGIPLGGVLIIVGIVGVAIVLAWVASRMGDSRPSM